MAIEQDKENNNVALVLSGGAARGIAHIGVIEELVRQGYNIHSIAGTSMGALVGGVYALGKLDEFKNWLVSLDKREIIKLLDFTFSSPGLIKGNKVLKKMESFIPEQNIETLDITFSAIATDINNNKSIVFNSGKIFDAIRASISIPALFTPVIKDDLVLVDGGVINNIPLNHIKRISNDILVASYVNADIPVTEEFRIDDNKEKIINKHLEIREYIKSYFKKEKKNQVGYFDLIYKSLYLPVDKVSQMRLKQYPPDILVEIPHDICGLFDFLHAERLVEIGRNATKRKLNN